MVVIHGKRLQSIGFVTSILPYIFFTWWVNNDMNNKVSQKLEIIGFKEPVKKSTSRIQEKPIKQTIDNILSNAAKSKMSAMTAEYNKLILETKGAL